VLPVPFKGKMAQSFFNFSKPFADFATGRGETKSFESNMNDPHPLSLRRPSCFPVRTSARLAAMKAMVMLNRSKRYFEIE
jgi:hypothetical protein